MKQKKKSAEPESFIYKPDSLHEENTVKSQYDMDHKTANLVKRKPIAHTDLQLYEQELADKK